MSSSQVQSITVTTQPTTTEFLQGTPLDTSGIVVKALIGSTYVEVTNSITYSVPSGDTSSLQVSDTYVTCHLTIDSTDYTTTYSITVYREACSVVLSGSATYAWITVDGTKYSSAQTISCYTDSTIVSHVGVYDYTGGSNGPSYIYFNKVVMASIKGNPDYIKTTEYTFIPIQKTTSVTINISISENITRFSSGQMYCAIDTININPA